MNKVKLVLMESHDTDYDSISIIRDSISEWEEVTDEELQFLQANMHRVNALPDIRLRMGVRYNLSASLVIQDSEPVINRILSIRELIDNEKAEEVRRQAEAALKKIEAQQKRELKRLKKETTEYDALVAAHGKKEADVIWAFLKKNGVKK